jgi:uncharacterized protein
MLESVNPSDDLRALPNVARKSSFHTLTTRLPWEPDLNEYPPTLQELRATFVTLLHEGHLRGCIGTTEATDPLIVSVAHNAHAAAFRDPRFPPLSVELLDSVRISVSLLTPAESSRYPWPCPGRMTISGYDVFGS